MRARRHERDSEVYDLHEEDRPYRWIGIVAWCIFAFYITGVFLFGVLTTPIENGQPVLADTEYRIYRRYVDSVFRYIEAVQDADDDLRRVAMLYSETRVERSSESASAVNEIRNRLLRIRKEVAALKVPPRFSGFVGMQDGKEIYSGTAFHTQFLDTIDLLINVATEMGLYFTDFNEDRWAVINQAWSEYNAKAISAFSLFTRIVGNQKGE